MYAVRNDGSAPYTVDDLEAALPVPQQASELRHPAVFGPFVAHLVTHRSVMAHTSRVPS